MTCAPPTPIKISPPPSYNPLSHHSRCQTPTTEKTKQYNTVGTKKEKKKHNSFCEKTCAVLQRLTHQQKLVTSAIETEAKAQLSDSKSSHPARRPYLQITGGGTIMDNKGLQRFNAIPHLHRFHFFYLHCQQLAKWIAGTTSNMQFFKKKVCIT